MVSEEELNFLISTNYFQQPHDETNLGIVKELDNVLSYQTDEDIWSCGSFQVLTWIATRKSYSFLDHAMSIFVLATLWRNLDNKYSSLEFEAYFLLDFQTTSIIWTNFDIVN